MDLNPKTQKPPKKTKKQKKHECFLLAPNRMAEPHGNRTAKLVEQTLNEIKEFTPEKAYLHIFNQDFSVSSLVFERIDENIEDFDKSAPNFRSIRERLSRRAFMLYGVLKLWYNILSIRNERFSRYLKSLKKGKPFEFYNSREKEYMIKAAQNSYPNIVAAATMRNMKETAKRNAARQCSCDYTICAIRTNTKSNPHI